MVHPLTDKQKQIIQTAIQLFSSKGSSGTSMQEIAEYCGISKGSLYLQFKSKEELEKNILIYCAQTLVDDIMKVERESSLPPREMLQKQTELILSHVLELREYLMMLLKEMAGKGHDGLHKELMLRFQLNTLRWFRSKVIALYGEEISPYTLDLSLVMDGLLSAYIRLMMGDMLKPGIPEMAAHLVQLLDDAAESVLRRRPSPLLPESQWLDLLNKNADPHDTRRHPLVIMKEMKQQIRSIPDLPPPKTENALDAIRMLEEELLHSPPRKVVLLGMMNLLEELESMQPACAELRELFGLYLN
ncbi:TetR/AcrR family transcriptional regulator [Paenibacillus sp. JX-17]|uniref:TetR/AcrR family transcriptional regulator n=1 Tax=Paenibacillus lacisoli TaxID=3064525 RepID=A0ABT9CB70_9BACL|nr:TetR/AcrR family transcriptional regulator [Paenibacillus sp. JX-17]MDO7906487.1 TetR/AcrR family transcriptional regulator [Paenibacillus sp. JX-17]